MDSRDVAMNSRILLNTEFFAALEADILSAKQEILIQTLSFEMDRIGRRLLELLKASPARHKRILLDAYTCYKINDRFVFWPWNLLDRPLRREWQATLRMIRTKGTDSVELRLSRDHRSHRHTYFSANHKKSIVIDGKIAYLGGINFCEHNFAWRDLMVRLESPEAAEVLRRDFSASWSNRFLSGERICDGLHFFFFNGRNNEHLFQKIFIFFRRAKRSIYLISPYVAPPLLHILRQVADRGVRVCLLTPKQNNYLPAKWLIQDQLSGSAVELRWYPDTMNHMKAALIDNEILILGSSNYDLISYHFSKELLVVCRCKDMIEEFRRKILVPDLAATQSAGRLSGRPRLQSLVGLVQQLFQKMNGRRFSG